MNYIQEIVMCLDNIGFIISVDEEEDINLANYQMDSMSFILFIVELETHFNIEIPDTYLNYQTLESLRGLANLIETLCLSR